MNFPDATAKRGYKNVNPVVRLASKLRLTLFRAFEADVKFLPNFW